MFNIWQGGSVTFEKFCNEENVIGFVDHKSIAKPMYITNVISGNQFGFKLGRSATKYFIYILG